jgi:serine/threonine protein kinase
MSDTASETSRSWPGDALPQGTEINGYRIQRVLGRGGFGITYLACDFLGQLFAIKEYFPVDHAIRVGLEVRPASDEDAASFLSLRQRFVQEAQTLVRLSRDKGVSDVIVTVRTFFEVNGTACMVMEFIEGDSLKSLLSRVPAGLSEASIRLLLDELLAGLDRIHGAGMMHRDIKPANIIVRADGRPVLIDFGSSRDSVGVRGEYTQIYTRGYAPIEQIAGDPQGAFSDIYAVGAVCYAALGGTVVDAVSRHTALLQGRSDPQPPAVQVFAGKYARQLLTAIDAALTPEPELRPQTVQDMRDLLSADADADADAETVVMWSKPSQPPAAVAPSRSGADTETVVVRSKPSQPPAAKAPSRSWVPFAAVALAVALLAGGYAAYQSGLLVGSPGSPTAMPPPSSAAQTESLASRETAAVPAEAQPEPRRPARAADEAASAPAAPAESVPADPIAKPTESASVSAAPTAPAAPDTAVSTPPQAVTDTGASTPPPQAVTAPPAPTDIRPNRVPEPSPLPAVQAWEQLRDVLPTVPCSALAVTEAGGAIRVSGLAMPSPGLDQFLARAAQFASRVDNVVEPLEAVYCKPVEWLGASITANLHGNRGLALRLERSRVPVGGALRMTVDAATNATLLLDLYQADGAVRHLARRMVSGRGSGKVGQRVQWTVTAPAGRHVVVALSLPTLLDFGERPDAEPAESYAKALLPALQHERGAVADAVLLDVVAARAEATAAPRPEPTVSPRTPAARESHAGSGRCRGIFERMQLGETLSDAERKILLAECRP